MTSLICVPQGVAIYTGRTNSTSGDEDLRARLAETIDKREMVQMTLKSIMARISAMGKDLASRNARFHADIADVDAKIKAIQEEIRAEILTNTVEDDLDQEFKEFDSTAYDFEDEGDTGKNQSFSFSFEETVVEESPEIKRLFRLIANKTHPDKTDDPELHSLFVAAKACRNNGDLQGLKDIWDLVTGKATALLNKLLKELADAKQELLNIKRQLDYLWQSIDYKLLKLYEQDRYAVYDATRTQLETRYKQLYAHYQMLLTVSGKQVGPTKLSFNFEIG